MIETNTRIEGGETMNCIYCNGNLVVKRGMRYNGLEVKHRFLQNIN